MSTVTTISVASDTVVSRNHTGGDGEGCGGSKHLYVGRFGTRDYDSFLKFNIDWATLNIHRLISATLNIYTDEYNSFGVSGEPGIMPAPTASDTPKVRVYRLTDAFTEGNNADGHFDSSDYTTAGYTTSNGKQKSMLPKGAALLNVIDITAIVLAWAPSTVVGGGRKTNYGITLAGTTSSSENWSGWAQEHGNGAERPSLTLTYDLGPTVPNTPNVLTPSGSILALDTFEGNFSDPRASDTLQSTAIEIYDAGHAGTGSAATNKVTSAAHGLAANSIVYMTSLTGGTGLSTFTPYYVKSPTTNDFLLSTTPGGSTVGISVNYSALTWSKRVASWTKVATESERFNAHFILSAAGNVAVSAGVNYRWRVRCTDQESQVSPWSGLVTFALSDTAPNPPVLSPISGASFSTLNLVKFQGGTFSDANAGDYLRSHQLQLSPFPDGDIRWDEADGVLWDSGEVFDSLGATNWTEYYSGQALLAGTYYWRARQWDQKGGVSAWTYATIVLTADFNPDPASYDAVQVQQHAPWRIIIRNLKQADGVTPTVGRAPGQVVAIFEEAKNVGASIVYNSPGELHFTLLKDDEQISEVEPKQTHYAVEFYSGDGWQEKYAGVIWDVDATETDVVFKGIDYLALYDTVIDERYDPLKPNRSYASGGSYYSNATISTVINDQLTRAKNLTDSWVGFIAIGSIATMNEKVTVYSTMQPVLSFVAGLIDSHRQGTGKRTRMKVIKTTGGTYQLQIVDDPGVIRSDLALYYGELVQGYRVIVFGDGWANVEHVVGRNRDGVKVVYQTISGKPFQPSTSVYGRIATVSVMDGVQDQNDLHRRGLQAAIQSAKLGKNIAIGLRTQFLSPLQGWDVCDVFPVKIDDGAINTDNMGSGYWAAYAAAWEATDIGEQSLVITLLPREDTAAPDPDLIPSRPVSTQPEWQLGWKSPAPTTTVPTSNALLLSLDTGFFMDDIYLMDDPYLYQGGSIYVDMTTGLSYELQGDGTWLLVSGQATLQPPSDLSVTSRKVLTTAGVTVTNVSVVVTP